MSEPTLVERRDALGAAVTAVITAMNACRPFCRMSTASAADVLIAGLTAERGEIANEIARRIHRFDGVPVLQARIAYGEKSAKIACAKPSEKCDEPSISETAYNALLRRLAVPDGESPRSMEAFPVAVIGRNGQTVAAISPILV